MQVRPVQIQYVDDNHKKFAAYCNSLRCPLCGSQLDGLIHQNKARLYCVGNNNEYKVHLVPNQDIPDFEFISFWYPQYQYCITTIYNQFNSGKFDTSIDRYNMDAHPSKRLQTIKNVFSVIRGERLLFFRKRMEEKEFLNKLKIYNIFS